MSTYSTEISELLTEASKLYALKDYESASLKYGEVCELYSSQNDGKEDIDLLFLYGKSLFQNGVSKSEAFGGGNGVSEEPNQDENDDTPKESANFQFNETLAEEEEEEEEEDDEEEVKEKEDNKVDTKPLESDSDEEVEEEQTDFELLWDILDLTRSLIEDKLSNSPIDIPTPLTINKKDDPIVKLTEKLSDTYDLLGEVSLELENFPQAATDLAKSLELRQKLYLENSQLISESHYKLSLALEFSIEDPESRSKAAEHMKSALDIVKAQIPQDSELIKDLEVRLNELNKDPAEELQAEKERIIKGILGEKTDDETESIAKIDTNPVVNDLTNMVIKKKRKSDNKKIPGQKRQKQ